MTEANREQISSLMDGELERGARDFLVRRLSSDPELSSRWRRYHMIRACLHKMPVQTVDLSERVALALGEDPELRSVAPGIGWIKPLAGTAIAASVAVAALVSINTSMLERGQPERLVEQPGFVSQPTALDLPFNQPLVPVSFSSTSAADRERISTYVLRHNQAAGGTGFASYVPIVAGARAVPADPDQPAEDDDAGTVGR